jgi:hypothetical protein
MLLDQKPDAALMLGCCGAPAEWAGDESFHPGVIRQIRSAWEQSGHPEVILACPMRKQMSQQYLPEVSTGFLYSVIQTNDTLPAGTFQGMAASV